MLRFGKLSFAAERQISPKRAVSTLAGLALAASVAFLTISFGPVPEAQLPLPNMPVAPLQPRPPANVSQPLLQPEMMLSLLGATRLVDSEGCDAMGAEQFVTRLENDYRRAGYQAAQDLLVRAAGAQKPLSADLNTYWRADSNGGIAIGSFGTGPHPGKGHIMKVNNGAVNNGSILEITSVSNDPRCGARWKKYHYELRGAPGVSSRVNRFETNPGNSRDVPLPAGTSHLFSLPARSGAELRLYSSAMSAASLLPWFRTAMSRTWVDTRRVDRNAGGQLSDMLYFTQADRYCMIFVGDKQHRGKSLVIVSIGRI